VRIYLLQKPARLDGLLTFRKAVLLQHRSKVSVALSPGGRLATGYMCKARLQGIQTSGKRVVPLGSCENGEIHPEID